LKLKFIIIIFNIIIVFFLSALAFIPAFAFGSGFAALFWRSGWPLAFILAAALVTLNAFFLINFRLYKLLEREDWPALADYLEQSVLYKGRYSPRRLRLLLNSYLVMSDTPAVIRLENKVGIARPALLEANALIFGTARILGGDPAGAADFFRLRLEKSAGKKDKPWLRWYYGFSLILAGSFDEAEGSFKALAAASADPLIAGLSAYLLSAVLLKHSANGAECRSVAEDSRKRVRKALKSADGWKREAEKIETDVYAAVIKKYIDEAGAWLFNGAAYAGQAKTETNVDRSEYE
jgi:hypothetical protein